MNDQNREAQAARKVLEDARSTISQALAFLQQAQGVTSATGENTTSFGTALQDAIFEIDSQPDLVDPYLDPSIGDAVSTADVGQAFSIGSLQLPRRQGRLQRIRNLKVALFGGRVTVVEDGVTRTDVIEGVIEPLKAVSGFVEEDPL